MQKTKEKMNKKIYYQFIWVLNHNGFSQKDKNKEKKDNKNTLFSALQPIQNSLINRKQEWKSKKNFLLLIVIWNKVASAHLNLLLFHLWKMIYSYHILLYPVKKDFRIKVTRKCHVKYYLDMSSLAFCKYFHNLGRIINNYNYGCENEMDEIWGWEKKWKAKI